MALPVRALKIGAMTRFAFRTTMLAAACCVAGCASNEQTERATPWATTTALAAPEPAGAAPAAMIGPASGRSAPPPRLIRTSAIPPPAAPAQSSLTGRHSLDGIASFYWQDQQTASGERFDRNAMTAAHKTLPFGTRVRVTDERSGRSVVVRINDRGPFKPGRVIDLSYAAAAQLGMQALGLTRVKLAVVD